MTNFDSGTVFWLGAAASVLLLAAILLWPRRRARTAADREATNVALYRQRRTELSAEHAEGRLSDAEHAQLVAELGAGLVRDAAPSGVDATDALVSDAPVATRGLRLGLVAAVALVAIVGYLQLGRFDDVELKSVASRLDASEAEGGTPHAASELAAMADALERRLAENPKDADGWFLLGRTAINLQDFGRAARAFAQVSELVPNEPAPVIYQAQAEFLRANRSVTPQVQAVVDRALRLSPDNPVMMELLAVDAFAKGEFQKTIDYLMRGAPSVTDPQQRELFAEGIRRAAEQLGVPAPTLAAAAAPALPPGMSGMAPEGAPGEAPDAALGNKWVEVDVRLKPGLGVPPDAVVFVTARAIGGSPMPLAVQRLAASQLPTRVRLDERTAMNPQLTIASAARVAVSARISRSGTAMRGEDDIEVVSGPIELTGGMRLPMEIGGAAGEAVQVAAAQQQEAAAAAPRPAMNPAPAATAASSTASSGTGTGTVLRVLVELGPEVRVPATTPVFVFARETGGSNMPVAVRRLTVAELPTLVTLDDSMAMQAGRNLSSVARVDLVARIARSGSVTPTAGDIEGSTGPIAPKQARQVAAILIDRVRR